MDGLRQIVTFGGGGFSMEAGNPLLDEFVLGLTGRERPKVCFLPSASGDADHYIVRFYRHFAGRCEPSHLSLFRRERAPADPREHLLSQDLIYVGGGSVRSLLGVWLAHGIDDILHDAWNRGVVLAGLSAGSLIWFQEGVSTFHGGPPDRVAGLGFLPWSNTVHYSSEPSRREALHQWLREGMPPAYAADDGAALHFVGDDVAQVVASRPGARAYRVECHRDRVVTTQLATRYLGDKEVVPLIEPGAIASIA